jgi:RND superfamily putative drug exporter
MRRHESFSAGRSSNGTPDIKVSFIQFFGLGTGFAILIDATLVRGVLVPAFMRAVGENSWYAPNVLRQLHNRIGLSDAEAPAAHLVDA